MTDRKLAELVRDSGVPGFDKSLLCKSKNPDRNGIMQTPKVVREISKILGDYTPPQVGAEEPHRDKRKFEHRYTLRLPEREHAALQRDMKRTGDKTVQDYLRNAVIFYRKHRKDLENKNAAQDARTSKAG